MSMLYLTGARANAYSTGTVSVSPAASSVAGSANLYDGDPSTPHIAGSIAADSYMQVQIQALTNPGFETSTLSGWTSGTAGTGTTAETTTAGEFLTGAKACEMTGTDSSNYGSRYQSITVSAGDYRRARVYIKAIGSGTGKLFLRNLTTGNYYNGSAWESTRAAAGSSSVTEFTTLAVAYQVESFDTCRADTVSLRWELACESGNVAFDDCLDVQGITFASIHGHNYGPVSPLVRSSDDGSAWTTRATMTTKRGAFFSAFAIIYAEYWRVLLSGGAGPPGQEEPLSGTNHEAPYTGEVVLGQYQTSATAPKWDIDTTRAMPGVRQSGPGGRASVYNFTSDPTTSLTLTFSARTSVAAAELSGSIWLRSGQGRYPVVVVPIDSEADVYYGRPRKPAEQSRPFSGVYESSLEIVGDPLPTVGL